MMRVYRRMEGHRRVVHRRVGAVCRARWWPFMLSKWVLAACRWMQSRCTSCGGVWCMAVLSGLRHVTVSERSETRTLALWLGLHLFFIFKKFIFEYIVINEARRVRNVHLILMTLWLYADKTCSFSMSLSLVTGLVQPPVGAELYVHIIVA